MRNGANVEPLRDRPHPTTNQFDQPKTKFRRKEQNGTRTWLPGPQATITRLWFVGG